MGAGLRQVFNGFFVQFSVVGRSEVIRDIVIAAPTIMLQLHLYRVDLHLTQMAPGIEQVLAFAPGGLSISLSREAAFLCRRRGVHDLTAEMLRQRFADLQTVPFRVKDVHPTIRWTEPVDTKVRYMVAVVNLLGLDYTTVLVQLWLPPLFQRGAIFCPRTLTKSDLVDQLRLESSCGDDGDGCFCYVNTYPLKKGERSINPGDYITCWTAERDEMEEVLSVEDSEDLREAAADPEARDRDADVMEIVEDPHFATGFVQSLNSLAGSHCGHLSS